MFHRLGEIEINVPSLNERSSDIPVLIQHFLKDISIENKLIYKNIDKNAVLQLQKYNWSGNVRELRNVIERLSILTDNNIISLEDVIKYSNKK